MYISDLSCISPQYTFDNTIFERGVKRFTNNRYVAIEPEYLNLIPAGFLRRMGKAVRMGVGAGLPLLKMNPGVDGIIIGSTHGGLKDSIKFLNQIVTYQEGALTPTNFVQSTPNSIAGNLALLTKNVGYNITHVHIGLAFENALLDAKMLLEDKTCNSLLVGQSEENSDCNYTTEFLAGHIKNKAVRSDNLIISKTEGTVCGEGSVMFIIKSILLDGAIEIIDIDFISYPTESEICEKVEAFLLKNDLKGSDIDALILGLNGDIREDFWYYNLYNKQFPGKGIFTFKNLVGEYPTVSAFAVWLSANILMGKNIPEEVVYKKPQSDIKNILIYNHYRGSQHGFILMRKD